MLVWVASYPRSASNLTLLTLRRVFGFHKGLFAHPDRVCRELGLADDDPLRALAGLEAPVFLKRHELPSPGDGTPAIYLVRDGRDSVTSQAHHVKDRGRLAIANLDFDARLDSIIRHGSIETYGNWSANVRAWIGRDAPTTIVRFETLIKDPVSIIREAVASLGIEPREAQRDAPTFDELHKENPMVFRAGVVGTWRKEMSAELEELFWQLHGSQMEALGYPR